MMSFFRLLAAATGWFALGLQYYLVMTGDIGPDPVNRTINFFSYFTILTNILVALAFTLPVIAPNSGIGRFFASNGVRTAIATYIIVVAITYHLILAKLWDPQGLDLVANNLLHYVMPALFVLDWLVFTPKFKIAWSTCFKALAFPLLYLGWTLYHGSWSGFYPYPFLDVGQLGMDIVLLNAAGMIGAAFVLCLLLTAIGRGLAVLFETS